MQEHLTSICLLLKIDFSPNSTLKAKECRNIEQFAPKIDFGSNSILKAEKCRNIEPLQILSKKLIWDQIQYYQHMNAGTSNLYQFAPKN